MTWTFLTNHGLALVYVARHPTARVREVATAVGVSERAALRLIHDLRKAGYLAATRQGRHNVYQLYADAPLRRAAHHDLVIANLLRSFDARS